MADYNELVAQIHGVLRPFTKPGIELTEETALVAELGLTSLQVMALIEQIEDHFDVSVPLNILPEIHTVGDLARRLESLV